MADILTGYRTYLVSKVAVTGVCGTRVYFGNLPQRPTYPCVVLHLINAESDRHLTNASALTRAVLQVDCFGKSHSDAENLAEQIRLVTEHYTGAWGTETVRIAIVTGNSDLSESPEDGSQLTNHIRSLDVVVRHTEALPT